MKSIFEELGGTYKQVGDYLLPDVEVPENPEVGFWGLQRRKYLLEHQPSLYTALFLGGKLIDHLQKIDRSATRSAWTTFPAPPSASRSLVCPLHRLQSRTAGIKF